MRIEFTIRTCRSCPDEQSRYAVAREMRSNFATSLNLSSSSGSRIPCGGFFGRLAQNPGSNWVANFVRIDAIARGPCESVDSTSLLIANGCVPV